jgi:hypothetical protein
MPHLYDAELELRAGGQVVARAKRVVGLRRLGGGLRQLIFDGKNWVLRGVLADELPPTDLAEWHDAETAMCVRNPSDALCDAASRAGVLLVAELGKADVHEIARLRRWPAVGIIAVTASAQLDSPAEGHNAIVAQRSPAGKPLEPIPWASLRVVPMNPGEPIAGLADCRLPVIAIRPAGQLQDVAHGRRACDHLQRELAPYGQFAGYIV